MNETILQFGTGRFLRGFFDRFVQNASDVGNDVGKIVVVQSTDSGRGEAIDTQNGYTVLVRGMMNGEIVDRAERVYSLSRILVASKEWECVRAFAVSPALRLIVSNTTEASFALDPEDKPDDAPPKSFPGKLTQLLELRCLAGLSSLTILPCELIESNGARLRELVLQQAEIWNLAPAFLEWVNNECVWLDSLVDCIVTRPTEMQREHDSPATVQAEPYALLAIQGRGSRPEIPPHPAITYVDDLRPIYLRKVRILNGLHSAMTALWLPEGKKTVAEVMRDPTCVATLRALLDEEILPTLTDRTTDVTAFADAVLERFRNPFITHHLADIALNHDAKKRVRLQPTLDEYIARYSKTPPVLARALAAKL